MWSRWRWRAPSFGGIGFIMGLAVSLMLFATVERRIVQSGAIVKQLAGKPHWSRHRNVLSAFVAISTEAGRR
jgi:ABC-type uncharacterized transport system YnjBCD permease subunit